MMRNSLLSLSFLLLSRGSGLPTEDCPILGPAFPSSFDLSETDAFQNATAGFAERIEALFDAGVVNRTHSSFAIDVYSTSTNESLFSYFHEAPALNGTLTAGVLNDDTIFRIGSVSKLVTAYAVLAAGGLEVLTHPVTNYIPELAGNAQNNPTGIIWEDVTVGALASHQAGVGGFPIQLISCLDISDPQCDLQEYFRVMRDERRPTSAIHGTALYADGGFAMLGRVLERMTGLSYDEAIQTQLVAPLELDYVSTLIPSNESLNGLIMPGGLGESSWGFDNQLSAPSGGVYSSNADLRTLGLSILNSQLLDPVTIRAWMKPMAHTSSLTTSVGAPWEIERLALNVSAGSNRTRISDLYTKLGGQAGYGTVFALSPDHGLGFTINVAGGPATADRIPLRNLVGEMFVTAAEHAAFDNAARNYAGVFVDDAAEGTNLTLTVDDNRAGLGMQSLWVNGSEWRAVIGNPSLYGTQIDAVDPTLSLRLYPTGPFYEPTTGVNGSSPSAQSSWRAAVEQMPTPPRSAAEGGDGLFNTGCTTWLTTGFIPEFDEFVFDVVDGRLQSVYSVGTNTTMRRID